ncbi:MAG TPA: hypothetical protein VHZ24_05970 [Pirellulales bacterium]|jgi:hypothetical protein|nr:hypothetical protein [Pirellulales bacterium]
MEDPDPKPFPISEATTVSTAKLTKPIQASLKSLLREFTRCSHRYPPLYYELFCPSSDLSQYEAHEVCDSFRQAFADRFSDAWESWHGPDDVSFFGRFFGSSEGLEEFTRLAESAYLIVCEIGPSDPNFKNFNHSPDHGYHGWLKLLHDMAHGYPTPLLRCEFGVWDEGEKPRTEEELARIERLEENDAPYPLHPFHFRLTQSVFTSSMAAIELILDDEQGLLVGDWTWGFPISFSNGDDEREAVSDDGPDRPPLVVQEPSAEPTDMAPLRQQQDLNEMEINTLQALGDQTMTADPLAVKAGYPCNSNFRTTCATRNWLPRQAGMSCG